MQQILYYELKYYFKNFHEVIYFSCFFILISILIPMGLRQQLHLLAELAPISIVMALVAGTGLGTSTLYQRDAEQGLLETYQMLPISLHSLILAKWLAFTFAILFPGLILLPAILVVHGVPLTLILPYAAALVALASVLSILANTGAVLTAGLERAKSLLFLLVMPLSIPAVIFSCAYIQHPADITNLTFVIALSIFLLPILCLVGSSCIRASN